MQLAYRIIITFVGVCLSSSLWAMTTEGLDLSANDISRDYNTKLVTLEGNVRIGLGDERIRCDKATINMKNQEIIAQGNVVLESVKTYIEGDKIVYNYKTRLGEIYKGMVQAGQVVFIGDLIKKKSETNFLAKSARYTSCATCPAAWSFSGYEIDAEIGGYAAIKYPVLRLADFPVMILPRIWVPLKSDRQSGVIVPSFDYSSKGGTAITLPYFWAISENRDLTYALKSYEYRGLKHIAEYRYVLSEGSGGTLNTAYLRDQAFSADGSSSGQQETFNRGFLTYKHYYEMPNQYIHRANINLVSDLRYPRDFSEEIAGYGDSALENKMSLTKNSDSQHFGVEAAYYTNLLKEGAQDDNSDSVHRFPEINYSLMEQEIYNTNLFFKFDFNYTNFARRDFAYDDIDGSAGENTPKSQRDGAFNYNGATGNFDRDLIRTGHRYIFQPSISYPFHIGNYLDVLPSVTYNETQYRFNVDDSAILNANYERNAARRYLQTDISFKTKYSAIYGEETVNSNRYKHEIEPELIYSRIPVADRPDHLFFGDFENQPESRRSSPVSTGDFDGSSRLQFDYRDRLFDKDLATFVLSNYVIRKRFSNDLPYYQKFVTFRVAQSYDFNVARQEDPKPWSNVYSLLDVRLDNFETHTTAEFYPYADTVGWSTRLKVHNNRSNYLEFSFSENVIVAENQTEVEQRTETVGTGLGFVTKYFDLVGRTKYSLTTEKLESWEYVAMLKPPGDCWSIRFGHKKVFGADTDFNFSFNFEFGGI
jgi:LPS-assembly protein